jgi:hypothetical protein
MEKMKRIYIAGPMCGVKDFNRAAFTEHAARLRALGWAVENPVEIGGRFGTLEEIDADTILLRRLVAFEIETLKTCDALFLLAGWEFSAGTRAEIAAAIAANLPIYVQKVYGALPNPDDPPPTHLAEKTSVIHFEINTYNRAIAAATR